LTVVAVPAGDTLTHRITVCGVIADALLVVVSAADVLGACLGHTIIPSVGGTRGGKGGERKKEGHERETHSGRN